MASEHIRIVKPELRILGIHDGGVFPVGRKRIWGVGVVMRGGRWVDGALKIPVKVGGVNATGNIIKAVKASKHYGQLRVILLESFTVAGGNTIDVDKLWRKLKLPVIVLLPPPPTPLSPQGKEASATSHELRLPRKYRINKGKIDLAGVLRNIVAVGVPLDIAGVILQKSTIRGATPEPLRLAQMLAYALNNPF